VSIGEILPILTGAKMGKISEQKKEERGYLDLLSRLYGEVPRGSIIPAESPDFIIRGGRKKKWGVEVTRLTRQQYHDRPDQLHSPELTREALTELIRMKEEKLYLYRRKNLLQIWLLMVVDGFDAADSFNIFDRKSNVRQSRTIDRWLHTFFLVVVFEYLQRWTIIAIPRQAKMNPSNLCARNPSAILKALTGERSFRQYWSAAKNLFIELRQSLPVLGNDVGVHEPCIDSHILPQTCSQA
jgi:hypothetical protein